MVEVRYEHDGDGDAEITIELVTSGKGIAIVNVNGEEVALRVSTPKTILVKDCHVKTEGIVEYEPNW